MTTLAPPFPIGPRVRYARESLRITQAALAHTLGFKDRQTVSDIEQGKRAVKADELLALGAALDRDLDFFLDPFQGVAEARYAWGGDAQPAAALDQLEALANGGVGMARWLWQQDFCPQAAYGFLGLRLGPGSTGAEARAAGKGMAALLGPAPAGAPALAQHIETQLGIPVLFLDPPAGVSPQAWSYGLCQVAGFRVILLNRQAPPDSSPGALAHALFHALTWGALPPGRRALETDRQARRTTGKPVAQLARQFSDGLLSEGLLMSGSAPHATVAPGRALPPLLSPALVRHLHMALDKGRLTARKAATTLGMPLFELTALFEAHGLRAPFDL